MTNPAGARYTLSPQFAVYTARFILTHTHLAASRALTHRSHVVFVALYSYKYIYKYLLGARDAAPDAVTLLLLRACLRLAGISKSRWIPRRGGEIYSAAAHASQLRSQRVLYKKALSRLHKSYAPWPHAI